MKRRTRGGGEFEGAALPDAIRFLETRLEGVDEHYPSAERPIFLLSAGWRSGSTLVQRLINSDPSVLMWGEPFEDSAIVHRLARSVELFGPDTAHLKYTIDRFEGSLSNEWVANLNPGLAPLRRGHREFFERLFAEPARTRGHSRWGCKWVRLAAGHAYYLRWIYPAARFVFLIRHPLHSLLSYHGRHWYFVRPNMQVTRASQFLDHWQRLAGSYLAEHRALGAMLVRYEDIVSGEATVQALSEYLGVRMDRGVLDKRIGARGGAKRSLGPLGRFLLARRVGALCKQLGYEPSGAVLDRPTDAL